MLPSTVSMMGMLAPRLQTAVLPLASLRATHLLARAVPTEDPPTSHASSSHPFLARPEPERPRSDRDAPASGIVLQGLGLEQHANPQYTHPLVQYRASYPEEVWRKIMDATGQTHPLPVAIDIGVGTGRGAVELARRGYRVVGVEATPSLLAHTHMSAASQGVALNLISARMEHQLLPPGCADLVSVMHGLHLVDPGPALREAHRLLRQQGLLAAAWNDRDMSSTFNQELEGLLERFNPEYNRHSKQRSPDHWAPTLTQGDLFRLEDYSVAPHALPLKGAAPLLDIVDCQSCVRHSRRPSAARRELHRSVVDLVHKYHGHSPFVLPLETKLYLLRRNQVQGLEYEAANNSNGMRPLFE